MYSLKLVKALVLIFMAAQITFGAQYRVAQDGSGGYTKIQDAINAAKTAKDASPEIIILDLETYNEQVTIDSMSNVILRSEKPSFNGKKPVIKFLDKINVHPVTKEEATNPNQKNWFDENGALRVQYSHGVRIEGITVDGGGAWAYSNAGVWYNKKKSQYYPLMSGNAALHLTLSGDVIVRFCEFRNAYHGINFKDRNVGGIFANPNPSDVDSLKIVPNSGFGKTGNHIIDQCKIHDNAWGMFFESVWDLGSTIRFNLFYNNYLRDDLYALVKAMPDGTNEAGGAMCFKDNVLSPLAIYNNTFWHNHLIFCGQWKAGPQHLVFNNIYASPIKYWSVVQRNDYMHMDHVYLNRTHNVVYSVQAQALGKPQPMFAQTFDAGANKTVFSDTVFNWQPQIMNDIGQMENVSIPKSILLSDGTTYSQTLTGLKVEGNRVVDAVKAWPAAADVRWLEPHFKSTDSSSADFLTPDWTDSLVNQFIVKKGWPEAGIVDAQGNPADLGAIQQNGVPQSVINIKPTFPLINQTGSFLAKFNVTNIVGEMKNPVIKYFTLINKIADSVDLANDDLWSSAVKPIPKSNIYPLTPIAITLGANSVTIPLPTGMNLGKYAFVEMIIEGTDATGNKITSTVGFLPYRKLDYMFKVEVLDASNKVTTTVKVGDPVTLRITPYKVGQASQVFANEIAPVEVSLTSNNPLLLSSDGSTFKLDKVQGITVTNPVFFRTVPVGGTDNVSVNGVYAGTGTIGTGAPFGGISENIKIIPGDPAKVLFQDPPSGGVGKVSPGALYTVRVDVFDKYDNKVTAKADISLSSLDPQIGDVVGGGPKTVTSDDTGSAFFAVSPTEGNVNDTFHLKATLVGKDYSDNAKMVVDKARNKIFIYYSDTAAYNPSVEIPATTCSGTRVPVKIRVSTNGIDTVTTIKNTILIEFNNPSIAAYESDTASTAVTQVKLVDGFATIWIQAKSGSMRGASITVTNQTAEVRLINATRGGINFTECLKTIDKGEYRAENGFGRVDRLDLYYYDSLKTTEIPDSLLLYWPDTLTKRVVPLTAMTLDSTNKKHLIVKLPNPFPEGITYSGNTQLGKAYWKNPALVDVQEFPFNIKEKVGPIIMRATLIERLQEGLSDTLIVKFSEFVNSADLTGNALQLVNKGGVALKVLGVVQLGVDSLKIIVANQGEDKAPKSGDSLKILVDGTGKSLITDVSGNYAHPDNRPVVIDIKEIPPTVTSAFYEDSDGDGTIDHVTISYSKEVSLADLRYCVHFKSTIVSDTIRSDKASFGVDKKQVVLDLTSALPSTAKGFTDGAMNVDAVSAKFPGVISGSAIDKAAPVIDSAAYIQGRVLEDGKALPDTVMIIFSEAIATNSATGDGLFQFVQVSTRKEYKINLISSTNTGKRFMYVVSPSSPTMLSADVESATSGDSVRILVKDSSSNFTDPAGNVQKVPTNHLERMIVVDQPVPLVIKIGPSPFVPTGDNAVTISISPQLTRQQKYRVQARVTILDNMGSLIYALKDTVFEGVTGDANKKGIDIQWKGVNKKGRLVGTGTYAVFIKKIDLLKGIEGSEMHKLAVKRFEATK